MESFPFTHDEIYRAVLLIASESDARATADALALAEFSPGASDLTQDTLILLSLLSAETAAKVAEYRAAGRWARPVTSELAWERRRAQLQDFIEARRSGEA